MPTPNPLISLDLFSKVTTQSYYFVRVGRSRAVPIGQRHKVVERLALIERDDLVHATDAELFSIRMGDVMRWHLWIGPAEHRHHLALGAVGVSSDLSTCLAHAVAALLRLVDAGEHRVLFELHCPCLLVHG